MSKEKNGKSGKLGAIAQSKIDSIFEFYQAECGREAIWKKTRVKTGSEPNHKQKFSRAIVTALCAEIKRQGENAATLTPPGKAPATDAPQADRDAWNLLNKHYQVVMKGCAIVKTLGGPITSLPVVVKTGKQGDDVDCRPIDDKDAFLDSLGE